MPGSWCLSLLLLLHGSLGSCSQENVTVSSEADGAVVLLAGGNSTEAEESRPNMTTMRPTDKAMRERREVYKSMSVMLGHSNLCLEAYFHKDDPERRLDMRITATLVRCTLLKPFCSFLMKDSGQVTMGCLKANAANAALYKKYMEGKRVSTTTGDGAICDNVMCQLEEALRQGIPDSYQMFRWKFYEWIEDQQKRDEADEAAPVQRVAEEGEGNSLSAAIKMSMAIVLVVVILATAGVVLAIIGYKTRRRDRKKDNKKKKKPEGAQELLLEEMANLQEKTESQAKMTAL